MKINECLICGCEFGRGWFPPGIDFTYHQGGHVDDFKELLAVGYGVHNDRLKAR